MAKRKYATTTLPAILALRDKGLNWNEVAERLNVNAFSLRSAMSLLGIQSAVNLKTAAYPFQEWVKRLERGDAVPEIAAEHGISGCNVHSLLRTRGLPTTCSAAIKARAHFLAAKDAAVTASRRTSVSKKSPEFRTAAHP